MDWGEYRKEVVKYRKWEYDPLEYLAILCLGVSKEFNAFMQSRKGGLLEVQLEVYGDILFNVAELWNILEDVYHYEDKSIIFKPVFAPHRCVDIVKKYYLEEKDKERFIKECYALAEICHRDYVCTITAEEAMVLSANKMKERHG